MVIHTNKLVGLQAKGTMVGHKQSVGHATAQGCYGDEYKQLARQQPAAQVCYDDVYEQLAGNNSKCSMVISGAAAQEDYGRA